jgi:hypothetical protein
VKGTKQWIMANNRWPQLAPRGKQLIQADGAEIPTASEPMPGSLEPTPKAEVSQAGVPTGLEREPVHALPVEMVVRMTSIELHVAGCIYRPVDAQL